MKKKLNLAYYLEADLHFKKGFRYDDLEEGIGTLTLSCNGREYKVDSSNSYFNDEDDHTSVTVEFVEDRDLYEDCKFDLTMEDLKSKDIKAVLYMGGTDDLFICGALKYNDSIEEFLIPLTLEE